ncbi:MAG: efflux RND transporter periplasmic adaptor subunit [Luteimonas sp.]
MAAVVALAVLTLWLWSRKEGDDSEGNWRTVAVERGDIRVAISATGTLSATSTVVIGSQISGQVTEVLVDFNDRVQEGQVIARIDPSSFDAQIAQGDAQVASARASLRQAEAALRNAEIDYQRKSGLAGQQLVARSDLDLARSARDQAQAQVNAARAQITQQSASTQTTRINLARTVIRSPVDGVVLTRSIEPGQTVAASLQAPELFTIAEDLGKMKIELAVDEADIGQVKVGQGVTFTADAFADRQFRGTVDQVRLSATNTNNVVTYPVVVAVDNSDGTLLPGLTVNAEIEVSRRDDVLKVANAALRYKPTGAQAEAVAAQQGGGARGGGMTEDLEAAVASMQLDARQRAAFDAALAAIRERQAAREAAPREGGNRVFGGGGGGGGGPRMATGGGNLPAQLRQRMMERFQQDFTAFRASLDDAQRTQWDTAMAGTVGARRAPLYKLEDGQPLMVMVRIGASDGTSTEIAGDIQAGDTIITGERAGP